jgi:hypothetical protein
MYVKVWLLMARFVGSEFLEQGKRGDHKENYSAQNMLPVRGPEGF